MSLSHQYIASMLSACLQFRMYCVINIEPPYCRRVFKIGSGDTTNIALYVFIVFHRGRHHCHIIIDKVLSTLNTLHSSFSSIPCVRLLVVAGTEYCIFERFLWAVSRRRRRTPLLYRAMNVCFVVSSVSHQFPATRSWFLSDYIRPQQTLSLCLFLSWLIPTDQWNCIKCSANIILPID